MKAPWKMSPAASVSTAAMRNTGSARIASSWSRHSTGSAPLVTAMNALVASPNFSKAAPRSFIPMVARNASCENTMCEQAANSGSPGVAGLSASSTTGTPRRSAARQIGSEKVGKRLSASTASAPAASAAASRGATASSRWSR